MMKIDKKKNITNVLLCLIVIAYDTKTILEFLSYENI